MVRVSFSACRAFSSRAQTFRVLSDTHGFHLGSRSARVSVFFNRTSRSFSTRTEAWPDDRECGVLRCVVPACKKGTKRKFVCMDSWASGNVSMQVLSAAGKRGLDAAEFRRLSATKKDTIPLVVSSNVGKNGLNLMEFPSTAGKGGVVPAEISPNVGKRGVELADFPLSACRHVENRDSFSSGPSSLDDNVATCSPRGHRLAELQRSKKSNNRNEDVCVEVMPAAPSVEVQVQDNAAVWLEAYSHVKEGVSLLARSSSNEKPSSKTTIGTDDDPVYKPSSKTHIATDDDPVYKNNPVATEQADLQSLRKSKESHVDERILHLKIDHLCLLGMEPLDAKKLTEKRAFVRAELEIFHDVFAILLKFFKSTDVACKVLVHNHMILKGEPAALKQKLKILKDFDIGEKACMKIGTSRHAILAASIQRLEGSLSYFRSVGLSVTSINTILFRFPQVLRLSVEISLRPSISYLESMGMSAKDISEALPENPSLLSCSVDKNLAKKLGLLQELGLSVGECIRVIGFSKLHSYKGMLMQVSALKSFGLGDSDIADVFRKKPGMFLLSADNLTKKLDYLINVEKRDIKEIMHYPGVLCFDIRRMIHRIDVLRETGKLSSWALSTILAMSTSRFNKQFGMPEVSAFP
eukprot:c24475_g1_i1 orf=145-2055(+)